MARTFLAFAAGLLCVARAMAAIPPVEHLEMTLPASGAAEFAYPDGPRGAYRHGFRLLNDGTRDWSEDYGLRFDLLLPDERPATLTAIINPAHGGDAQSVTRLCGAGWHTVTLPWNAFEFEHARKTFLRYVKALSLSVQFDGAGPGHAELRGVRVIKAPSVALETDVRGKAAVAGQSADYAVTVSNCTDQSQAIALTFLRPGWESMTATVEPAELTLKPEESAVCTVRVQVPAKVPPGGHEIQTLQAVANGDAGAASTVALTTVSELPHPYILHTPARWQEVRDKVKNYAWAKKAQDDYVRQAEEWRVPEVAKPPGNDPDDNGGPYLFNTNNENPLMACGIAWQLTGNRAYAEKVALFLRRLSDPKDGYPVTWRGCNQGQVQEGHFFQHIAMAYDMALNSGVFTAADRAQIEATFRIELETMNQANDGGMINNWNVSEVTGAFYVSLAMQDLASAERFFSGPGGIQSQLAKGTMDDGWWYECSIGYNVWCASEFTQAALAYEPFGVHFSEQWLPASYAQSVLIASALSGGAPNETDAEARYKPFGISPDITGPIKRPYRRIRDLWDGLLPFLDYRGVMFGVNDSTENVMAGNPGFEMAYYVYRDPAYAAIIKEGGGVRDLLYGVPELPENTPEQFRDNAYADNVGLAMLRSQTPGRPQSEQIQAVLHYGTHGWAHGHFDRTDLLSLFRYGRSFWNPESIFYVYEPFMYKFYTQTSDNHNMVVVDEKMQEATPGRRLLFHAGKMVQTTAVETTARWSNPPYGGMVYDYVPVKTFAEKTWREGRYVPIPKDAPKYGSLTGYTEPILQRRLLAVTDDYIVLADYLKGTQPHTFESLFQLKGFRGLDAPQLQWLRHDAQWNPDPLGSAQFVTDANWQSAQAPARAKFTEKWGPDVDSAGSRSAGNAPGVLNLDVHSAWPARQEIMVANAPEWQQTEKRLFYTVRGDGKTLAEGKFGAWILGEGDIDVPVDGVQKLELETKTELARMPSLFWANARLVTRDGKEIPLAKLAVNAQNVTPGPAGLNGDYAGGPIKIAGNAYATGLPAEPRDEKQPALITVDLSGLDAVRFKAVVGGDYPSGPEADHRRVYAIRAPGKSDSARFLTVIEPYDKAPVVKSVHADSADHLEVELTDGRLQEINLSGMEGDGDGIALKMIETKDGQVLRTESTAQP